MLTWSHPLGADTQYQLYYLNDQPITEANWLLTEHIDMDMKEVDVQAKNDTYQMQYTWHSVPQGEEIYIVVRQSLETYDEVALLTDMLSEYTGEDAPDEFWMLPPSVVPCSNIVQYADPGFSNYLIPIDDLEIKPGENKGEIVLTWTNLLGADAQYKLYYLANQPIAEDNWLLTKRVDMDKNAIDVQEQNGAFRMEYTWNGVPEREKIYVVVRQSDEDYDAVLAKRMADHTGENIGNDFWKIFPSVLPGSNMLSLVDTGFRPGTDGFQFKNTKIEDYYGIIRAKKEYIEVLRLMFGDNDVCVKINKKGICQARSSAKKFARILVKNDRGQCSGFSTTAGRFFMDSEDPHNFVGAQVTTLRGTIDIAGNDDIYNYIFAYQYLQNLEEIYVQYDQSYNLNELEFANGIQEMMLSEDKYANIGIRNGKENRFFDCGGHSLLPYLLVQENNENGQIWVYDSNHSKSVEQVIKLDISTNHWQYNKWDDTGKFNTSDSDCGSIGYSDIGVYRSVREGDYFGRSPWSNNNRLFLIDANTSLNALASNGLMVGYTSTGEFVNEIPGAIYNVIDEGGNAVLILPEDDYVVEVVATTSADADFLVTGGEQTFSVSNVVENDQFALTDESVTYQNASTASQPEISISLEADDHSSNMTLQPTTATSGVEIQYDPATLDYTISGAEDFSYQLDLSYISEDGESNLQTNTIQHAADDSDAFNLFEVEDENDALQVAVDSNNDGTPDQTIEVENVYQPPEEEEQKPERSIAWKQWLPYVGGGVGVLVLGAAVFILIQRGQEKKRRRSSYGGYRPGGFDPSRRKPPASRQGTAYPSRNGGRKSQKHPRRKPPSRYDRRR